MKSKNLYRLFSYSYYFLILSSYTLWFYKSFKSISTPYGVRPHPSVSNLTHLHVLFVPFVTLLLGVLLFDHSFKQFKLKRKLFSGLAMVLSSVLMIFTGYVGQVMIDPSLREQVLNLHIIVSVLWTLAYLFHRFFKTSYQRKS